MRSACCVVEWLEVALLLRVRLQQAGTSHAEADCRKLEEWECGGLFPLSCARQCIALSVVNLYPLGDVAPVAKANGILTFQFGIYYSQFVTEFTDNTY